MEEGPPVTAEYDGNGGHGDGNDRPYAMGAVDSAKNIGCSDTAVVGKQGEPKKLCFQTKGEISVKNNFCDRSGELPQVVGGKDGRAGKAVSPLKTPPLEGGHKKEGIKGQYRIQIGREQPRGDSRSSVQDHTCKGEIDVGMPRQIGGQAKGCHIDRHAAKAYEDAAEIVSQNIRDQVDHIGCLCIAEEVTKIQNRICTEKAADKRH